MTIDTVRIRGRSPSTDAIDGKHATFPGGDCGRQHRSCRCHLSGPGLLAEIIPQILTDDQLLEIHNSVSLSHSDETASCDQMAAGKVN